MIKNKFIGAIAATAMIAFVAAPVTANAHAHKHHCYNLEACKDTNAKGCKDGAKMLTKKQCKKMGGTLTKDAAATTTDAAKK